jgi:glucose uptake protein GlcU
MFLSVVIWGCNVLPLKHYDTGDGIFFQFIMCVSIWLTGVVVNCIREFPKFYGLTAIGGAFWTLGNMFLVPVIKFSGIGLGSVFWNFVGMLINWSIARFGLFGVAAQIPNKPELNYIGVGLTICSIVIFLFVQTEELDVLNSNLKSSPQAKFIKRRPLIDTESQIHSDYLSINNDHSLADSSQSETFFDPNEGFLKSRLDKSMDRFSDEKKKILGIFLSIFCGIMCGISYLPIMYIQNQYTNASQDYNDYYFAYTSGILLASSLVFVFYCIYEKNNPTIYPETIMPAFLVGFLWAIGNICCNLATNSLSMAITVPISNCGPSCVAFVVAFFYEEIKGRANILVLCVGIMFAVAGSIICGLSL